MKIALPYWLAFLLAIISFGCFPMLIIVFFCFYMYHRSNEKKSRELLVKKATYASKKEASPRNKPTIPHLKRTPSELDAVLPSS